MLRFRHDRLLLPDADGWAMASPAALCERFARHRDGSFSDAVHAGAVLPMTLRNGAPLAVRVVVGLPLTRVEEHEWLDRFEAWLSIPDGTLAIASGIDAILSGAPSRTGRMWRVAVPAGDHRVEVFTHLPCANARVPDGFARPVDWFRASYPGEEPPEWMNGRAYLAGHPIHVIVRLTPLCDLPQLPPLGPDGRVPDAVDPRPLLFCPRGILCGRQDAGSDTPPPVVRHRNSSTDGAMISAFANPAT